MKISMQSTHDLWRAFRACIGAAAAIIVINVIAPDFAIAQDAAPSAAPAASETVQAQAAPAAETAATAEAAPKLDTGDSAWMLTSTVLVLAMIIPGLALFYGGLARATNMLSVLMQVSTIAVVGMIVWAVCGYSLTFTEGPFNQVVGGASKFFLAGVTTDSLSGSIPEFVFVSFQMTFAAITAALVVGGVAERMKFLAVVVFAILWPILSYYPIAHMVWSGGYLASLGALDFAGGTVVHINAGIAGLVGAIFVGHRLGYKSEPLPPHSLVMTYLGAGLLWVGWFGFNAGSAVAANGVAGLAMINTFLATAAAGVSWALVEWITKGKPGMLGLASGLVAGLVVITPAAGFVGPMGAIILGLVASPVCVLFCSSVKKALNYDDSLDVFGIHGVAGIIGAVGTGVFVSPALGGVGVDGYSMMKQVTTQFIAVGVSIGWCAIATIIVFVLLKLIGLRVSKETEQEGIDINAHGEVAYHS